jgi:hypothetical protein
MKDWLKKLLWYGLVLYIALHVLFYYGQRYVILPGWFNRASDTACNCVINTENNKRTLYAHHFKNPKSDRLMIYSHGNAGNLSMWKVVTEPLAKYCNVLVYDYGGYGASEGTPSEKGFYEDVDSVYQHAIEVLGYKKDQIIWYGRSIGSVVATWGAHKYGGRQLVLETPMGNLKSTVLHHAPFFLKGVALLLWDTFDLEGTLNKISDGPSKIPIHMILASKDHIIPPPLTEKLSQHATQKISVATGHNDVATSSQYWEFLDEIMD